MSMRISSAVAFTLLLTACDNRPDNAVLAEAEQAGDDGKISCAIDGATDFTDDCLIERLSGENGVTMIIRHPDGGFRRFNVLTDGHGLEAADGFDRAHISIVEDGKIQVSVGPDKYLLSAQIKPDSRAKAPPASQEDPAPAGS